MRIEVTYKRPQVLQALRYHFISRREIKFMMILVNIFALLSAGLFYFKLITPLPFLMSSFLWLAMMVAFWFWLPWMIYRRSKTFKDSFMLEIDENHLTIESERSRKIWAWREFETVMETPGFFHLYFDPRSFFLIPKDGFESIIEIQQARAIMQGNIKKK
ncbi:MAG: YcxB family protein [Chitinophagaceae bacterium]